ncbi:alpha-ribazole phosphatase [Desulfonema ishimotonii]|uniref:Alpha-ribazole phosphatase n=1 Tax=Desulfonema ishimotonii TaxID=45657 RepID=A0A401FR35_9BACT|nr:alpha-ribazole phosphatase [Desulfonema ishimotonii]GBC59421.1 alpha-ribazole phosphatase [Desulfonema ishimotonii]
MIFLMRHGQTESDGQKRFIGQTDLPLSPEGAAQIRGWRDALASVEFAGIFCSDLTRTRESARILAEGRGADVRAVPELREIDLGEWDGLPMSEVRARFPDAWQERGENLAGYRPPGGESFADVQARAVPAFERIAARTDGNLLIVAHAGVNRVILCHILGMPLSRLFRLGQDYACLNTIVRRKGSWVVAGLNWGIFGDCGVRSCFKNTGGSETECEN